MQQNHLKKSIYSVLIKHNTELDQQLRDEMSLSLKSYIEANHAASIMSDQEIFEHRRLQNLALRWLFNQ